MDFLLEVDVVNGFLLWTLSVLAGLLVTVLSWRKGNGWWLAALWFVTCGALLAALILWMIEEVCDAFSNPPWVVRAWLTSFVGVALLAAANCWRSQPWRKVVAAVAVPVFALTAVVGINVYYGSRTTVGALLGIP